MAVVARAPARPLASPALVRRLLKITTFSVLLLVSFVVLLPFIWTLMTSLKLENDIVRFPPQLFPRSFTFEHYEDIWHRVPFARLFLNTVIFAGGVTLISLLFDSLTAYALARLEFPGRDVLFVAILVTMMLPFQVTLIPIFSLLSDLGWINTHQGLIVPRATNAFGIFSCVSSSCRYLATSRTRHGSTAPRSSGSTGR